MISKIQGLHLLNHSLNDNILNVYFALQRQLSNTIIFVMNYWNHDFTLNNSMEQSLDSTESQVQFLKAKLLQTHSKLIKELQYTKELEEEVEKNRNKFEMLARDNEQISRKASNQISKQEKIVQDRLKQLELNLVESEKKNDLLRSDLDTMRSKTLELAAINHQLQEQNSEFERAQSKLTDKFNALLKEIKMRQISAEEFRQEAERFRIKYEKQVSNNQEAERQLQDLKRQRAQFIRCNQDLETALKLEREKQAKQLSEILMLQKQAKEWKIKSDNAYEESSKLKDQIHQRKLRSKSQERNLLGELQKLTQDYNNLQAILKQREMELESARRKPLEDVSRKKNTYEDTKQLVNKLEKEQQRQIMSRSSPTKDRLSPGRGRATRTYKEQKQEYLTMIESVGSMESQMLACNMQKKKILAEIDKIDQTRVKTKDMISRRRRLEVELQNQQKKLDHIKLQLKKMKVM